MPPISIIGTLKKIGYKNCQNSILGLFNNSDFLLFIYSNFFNLLNVNAVANPGCEIAFRPINDALLVINIVATMLEASLNLSQDEDSASLSSTALGCEWIQS